MAEIPADFPLFVPNILKEADINFVFKNLAKFGDYKDNKDIKKLWNCWLFFRCEASLWTAHVCLYLFIYVTPFCVRQIMYNMINNKQHILYNIYYIIYNTIDNIQYIIYYTINYIEYILYNI